MPEYLRPDSEILKQGDRLPHWQQGEVMQFVTFRLGDALPASKIHHYREQRKLWLANHPEPWTTEVESAYHRKFTWNLERWLDQGTGSCILKAPSVRSIVEDIMTCCEGSKVIHHAWVIMPNHVHALFAPLVGLGSLVGAWKSVSAIRIAKGPIWQRNYRDTLIRDGEHFANAVRYIRRNPVKARLAPDEFTLWESERAKRVQ